MLISSVQRLLRKRRKTVRWAAGLLVFYTLLGFFILPPIIRAVAAKKLSQQLDRAVSIDKVKLNPFVLSATVRGLLIKDRDGQPFISWNEVYVNFQLSSFLGRPWVFQEVTVTRPFARVQINQDHTLNFSDLIAKFSSNAPSPEPSRPLALRIRRLHIVGAKASLTDLTPHTPFERILGPLDVTLENFRTSPDNRNPYSFSGTTDAGEKFAWSGFFYLDPLRSQGELSLENLALNKYAPLYQDLVRFVIKDGMVDVRASYQIEWDASHRVASVTNTAFTLRSFKLAEPGSENNIVELPRFAIAGVSVDAVGRRAEVGSVSAAGARLLLERGKTNDINVVELAKPAAASGAAPGSIQLLLRSVTNAVALLFNTTNAWTAVVRDVNFQNCELDLEDGANSRPVRLPLDQITLAAKNIANVPGTNLTASLSLRWNTNGTVRTELEASLSPPTADIHVALDQVDLRPLDPYLESRLNVFILGSKLGMDGHIRLRTTSGELPEVTFQGNARLDDFSTVDGALGEDLLKWGSVRFSGIAANLNPPTVAIQEIDVDDAAARLLIETNHTINLLAALRTGDTNAPAAAPPESSADNQRPTPVRTAAAPGPVSSPPAGPPESLPRISIAAVVISNAQVRFTDRSLTPNVNLAIDEAGGTITGISSEEWQHADINLHAKVDKVGPVEITGRINPFSERHTNELKVAVKDVDLRPASPYAGKFAGYRIAKGKLDMNLDYHVTGRQLKSENLITLDQFTFGEKVNSPDATKLPVRVAVAILKDRNGRIELNVPIEGSLDDPEFRLGKVISRAVLNILTKVATSPFSLLGALIGGGGEEVGYQNFEPGSAALLAAEQGKLDGLARALYERPGLQLEIEGSIDPATDADGLRRAALDRQLRTARWQALRKSVRATTTPDQITLTPEERADYVKKLYGEALAAGRIDLAKLSANTNSAAMASLLQAPEPEPKRGATALMERAPPPGAKSGRAKPVLAPARFAGVTDPMELALLMTMEIPDSELQALAAERARVVRDYLLQAGRVEAERLFLSESATTGLRTEGARTYLQFR